jgi:hypothetical protein
MLKRLRRWIAWKLLSYMYWLEDRPNHSIRWYGLVYSMAHKIYPSTDQDYKTHAPSTSGVGFNALETSLFWASIEAVESRQGGSTVDEDTSDETPTCCEPDQDKVKSITEAFRNLDADQVEVMKVVLAEFRHGDNDLDRIRTERPGYIVLQEIDEGLKQASEYFRQAQLRRAFPEEFENTGEAG